MKKILKMALAIVGLSPAVVIEKLSEWSLLLAACQNDLLKLVQRLRKIEPDISRQELSETANFNKYSELKRRLLQAFQCKLMLQALESFPDVKGLTVVDIGDSAGTHMLYLSELVKERFEIDTIGVNLDPAAIEKIRARGQKAILCRAEDLDLGDKSVDLFTSFEMVEHLHNPAIFLRRLSKKSTCSKIVITVPYLKQSRVGLHHVRHKTNRAVIAEEEHVFELSPKDWTLLMLHAGWKVTFSRIYYQYPHGWPLVSNLLAWFWRKTDYEGFWGVILTKDSTYSDLYQDWED